MLEIMPMLVVLGHVLLMQQWLPVAGKPDQAGEAIDSEVGECTENGHCY